MSAITFAIAAALFHLAPVQTVKKCEKIDACRCSTDEGEINLWSLGSESPGQPRYVSSAARWVSTGFYKHKTSKAKGNDKRGVPREGTGVVFRLSSPVACFVQQNVETSLSQADKSVDTPCKIRKPRNFGLVILSR